jgi:hypothetical protein
MARSRQVVLTSLLVVAAGLLVALWTLYVPARASVGPLPASGLAIPASAKFVGGIDVKRFVASRLYRRLGASSDKIEPKVFKELEQTTGLKPERDIERVVVAGGDRGSFLAMVTGRFERYALSRAIETRKGVTAKKHEGVTLYLSQEGGRGASAVAFLDDETVLMGSQAMVESTVTNWAQGRAGLKENATLVAIVERVRPGSTFWVAGDQSLLADMPSSIPLPSQGSSGSSRVQLPAVKSLSITGDLDPVFSVEATAEASDESSAKSLADVVRGIVALASLQAQQKPELQALASAVSVTTEAKAVHVSARIPDELFDTLWAGKPAPSAQVGR